MNYSNPILICDENEEFRILVRDMLTKNGFFHIIESADIVEAMNILTQKKEYFILVEAKSLSNEMLTRLQEHKHFLTLADHHQPRTATLTARLGVEHVLSYPFHSKKLLDKMMALA